MNFLTSIISTTLPFIFFGTARYSRRGASEVVHSYYFLVGGGSIGRGSLLMVTPGWFAAVFAEALRTIPRLMSNQNPCYARIRRREQNEEEALQRGVQAAGCLQI